MGIGDWAQSPIPNPQSPIPNPHMIKGIITILFFYNKLNNLKILFNYCNFLKRWEIQT
jgi:hypothetical protein